MARAGTVAREGEFEITDVEQDAKGKVATLLADPDAELGRLLDEASAAGSSKVPCS